MLAGFTIAGDGRVQYRTRDFLPCFVTNAWSCSKISDFKKYYVFSLKYSKNYSIFYVKLVLLLYLNILLMIL